MTQGPQKYVRNPGQMLEKCQINVIEILEKRCEIQVKGQRKDVKDDPRTTEMLEKCDRNPGQMLEKCQRNVREM